MDIWRIRNQALAFLDNDLKPEKELLEEGFGLLDECIERLHRRANHGEDSDATFAAYCCSALVKVRRLALGSYSLCLDGLPLEAGSLARTLIEGWQVLLFFRLDPKRVALAVEENMPDAGTIAGAIDDEIHNEIKDVLWQLRRHYNQFSSHFSLKKEALLPLEMVFDSESLKGNIRSLFILVANVLHESVRCFAAIGPVDRSLAHAIYSFHEKGLGIFDTYQRPG